MNTNRKKTFIQQASFIGLFVIPLAANALSIKSVEVSSTENKTEVGFVMDGLAVKPKAFQTDSPPTIALDFDGVTNGMKDRSVLIEKGGIHDLYLVEVKNRLRIVAHLDKPQPYTVSVKDDKVVFTVSEKEAAKAPSDTVNKINVSTIENGKTQIRFELNGAGLQPQVFQTLNPNKIAIDFDGLKNGTAKNQFNIDANGIKGISVVESKNKLRAVVDLDFDAHYETIANGNHVDLILTKKTAIVQPTQFVADKKLTDFSQEIKKIDFRKGHNNSGILAIELNNENTIIDIDEKSSKINFKMLGVKPNSAIVKHYDVMDFGSPVDSFDVKPDGSSTLISLNFSKPYKYSSFQSGNNLTIEFNEISKDEVELKTKNKSYSGEKLSLNFQNIEIRSVLQILADFTSLNIIASDTVVGAVTLRLNDVPWDQALDLILKSKGLSKRQKDTVVLIAPTAEISKIEEDELKAQQVVSKLEPLVTEYIQVNYARAETLKGLLMGSATAAASTACALPGVSGGAALGSAATAPRPVAAIASGSEEIAPLGFISNRGNVLVDSRTNKLIVRDVVKNIDEIKALLKLIDKPVPQVLIESRIVIASDSFARQIGVNLGAAKAGTLPNGANYGLGGPGSTTALAPASAAVPNPLTSNVVNLATGSPYGALGMTLARGADYVLNLELSALQDTGEGEVLSNPRLTTADRCKASIKQGVQIPYITTSLTGTTTQLIDAALELTVTPQITPDGTVIMQLDISKDNPSTISNNGNIAIDNRSISTNVNVKDGETIILGGVFESTSTSGVSSVPWFGDLPVIGNLFKRTLGNKSKKELLIFVTPKIIAPIKVTGD